ncbi:MAG: hypothetical protein IE913_06905 [Halothiobacillus sp.]|nr:hypothetical protein [Halothiobacillus sp.]
MIAGASVLMALLSIKIPSMASSLLSGAPSLGGAAAVGAAAGAAAGVAGLAVGGSKLAGMAGNAVGAAGGAATKGIAAASIGVTGMAQAVGAASNLATASGFTPGSAAHAGATAGNMVAGLGAMAATGVSNMAGSARSAVSGAAKGAGERFNRILPVANWLQAWTKKPWASSVRAILKLTLKQAHQGAMLQALQARHLHKAACPTVHRLSQRLARQTLEETPIKSKNPRRGIILKKPCSNYRSIMVL